MNCPEHFRPLLTALYRLGRSNCPINIRTLALLTGQRLGVVACQLHVLDQAGLVDSCRIRLTLAGLVVAVDAIAHQTEEPRASVSTTSEVSANDATSQIANRDSIDADADLLAKLLKPRSAERRGLGARRVHAVA